MGMFTSSKLFFASPRLIPYIAKEVSEVFRAESYEVGSQDLLSGGADLSIAKGGLFKSVLGMKTALKITIVPRDGNIYAEAGVGIFGEQAVPTIISFFLLWPIILTQIWGIIQQSNLDNRALQEIDNAITRHSNAQPKVKSSEVNSLNCPKCGAPLDSGANFCHNCGYNIAKNEVYRNAQC